MSVKTQVVNNSYEWDISGEVDMAAGVTGPTAVRGDEMTVARGGVGLVVVTVKNSNKLRLVELLNRMVTFAGASAPTLALGCRVVSVTQTTDTDVIVITIATTATSQGSGTNTDGGTAVTLSFGVKIRCGKLTNPLA